MKYLCDSCSRLVAVGRFSVDAGVLRLRCPVCEAESLSAPTEPPPREAAVLELVRPQRRSPDELCPKCAAPRATQAEACPKCGLVFALFHAETFALPEQVEQLWTRCEQGWSEAQRHEEFLAACSTAGLLPEAARRYRLQAEQRPGDPLALRYRDETVARLMASCVSEPSPAGAAAHPARPLLWLLFLACAALAGYGLFQLVGPPALPAP